MSSSTTKAALAPGGAQRSRGIAAVSRLGAETARNAGHDAPLSAAFALLLAAACWMLLRAGASNAAVALVAGATWCVSVSLSLTALRLDPLSPAMVYLYLLGLFHLGLVVPWALGIETSQPAWLITNDLNPALAVVVVAITSYHAGAALAVWLWPAAPLRNPASSVRCYNSVLCSTGLAIVAVGLLAFGGGVQSLGLERLLRSDYAARRTRWQATTTQDFSPPA